MFDNGPAGGQLFPMVESNLQPAPLVPLVELPPVSDVAPLRPFFDVAEVSCLEPVNKPGRIQDQADTGMPSQEDTHPESVITEDDLKIACEKAYQDGLQAGKDLHGSQHQEQGADGEQGYGQGYDQGFALGLEAGKAQGLQEQQGQLQSQQALLRQVITQLESHGQAVDKQLTDAITQLVSGLTRELVQAELKLQPDTVRGVIQKAVALLPRGATQLRIYVHPEALSDLDNIDLGHDLHFELIADDSQEQGGCRVICDQAEVDASLSVRLEGYLESVRQTLGSTPVTEHE